MKIQGIYKIKNLLNGKVYIGQSIDVKNRFGRHKYNSNYKIVHPLYNSFRKYGIENFEFNIIEHVNDFNKLDEREQYWTDFYKSYNKNYGYNIRCDCKVNRGFKHSDKTKDTMSLTRKGRVPWNKGMKMSDEYKQKCSEGHIKSMTDEIRNKTSVAKKGKKLSEEHKRKIGLAHKGRKRKPFSKKTRKNMSKAKITLWQNPLYREKIKLSRIEKRSEFCLL